MADTKQTDLTRYDGHDPAWVPHLIKALEGLRTGVRELTDAQKAIILEHQFLKDRLAGPLIAPPGPVVTDFTPTSGNPGTPVTIFGQGFSTAIAVHFAGARSSDLQINNKDGSLKVCVPPDANTGPLTVFTADGAGTSRDSFTVTEYQSQSQTVSKVKTGTGA